MPPPSRLLARPARRLRGGRAEGDAGVQAAGDRAEGSVETRTMVASSGRLVRAEFEQTMREWAREFGLQCEVIEHPHLLSTQVGFTVTGPRRKIDEIGRAPWR